jgi:ubiquitin C-terminal hydrolase
MSSKTVSCPRASHSFLDAFVSDEVKNLFEGSLRSVLLCQECGSKRVQTEPFMSISLPLSKELAASGNAGHSLMKQHLSVDLCLRHFTMPEMLSDDVDCPSCRKKTKTKKQHVVSKLPKILCLHLKRFEQNKKIEDFVEFPSNGLNMGPTLAHWCEVSQIFSRVDHEMNDGDLPLISYDLFGTVNHHGNLQSGHYVANVKVDDSWFHVNDSHVSCRGEAEVLKSDGAYLLFYIRR